MFKKLVLILIIISTAYLQAQTIDADNLFSTGLILYRNGQFSEALGNFKKIVDDGHSPKTSSALLMAAQSSFNQPDYEKTEAFCDKLVKQYPTSKYCGDAHFLLARIYLERGEKHVAISRLLQAHNSASNENLRFKVQNYLLQLVDHNLSSKTISTLETIKLDKNSSQLATILLAKNAYLNGDAQKANSLLQNLFNEKPENDIKSLAQNLVDNPPQSVEKKVKIGVIQPLTGYFSEPGTDMVRGISFALKQSDVDNIELYLQDSQGSVVSTIQAVNKMVDMNVDLIIGEMESSISAVVSAIASQANIPVLVPFSTDNGIASISSSVYQCNSDLETRGRALANYAINELNMQTFAMLAPADEYGHALTDAFSSEIDNLGGTILAQQWYYPGTQNFRRQFDAVRNAGIRYALRDSLELVGLAITPDRIDSLFNFLDDSLKEAKKEANEDIEGLIESTEISINSIDGFFFPIYEEDFSSFAPQFALSNIIATPLGGAYWYNDDALRKQRRYLEGAVMCSGYYFSELDTEYKKFVNEFRLTTFKSPEIYATFGFNIGNMLIQAVQEGATQKSTLNNYFKKLENYHGIGMTISFKGSDQVNNAVNILQFNEGNFIKLN